MGWYAPFAEEIQGKVHYGQFWYGAERQRGAQGGQWNAPVKEWSERDIWGKQPE